MKTIQAVFLFFAIGLLPATADESNCANCYQEGLEAWQLGEHARALRFFESGCERDDGAACYAAARMLSNGKGAPEDTKRGGSLGFRACDLGYWLACGDLGEILVRAEAPEVVAKGRSMLERACEGGYQDACKNLEILAKAAQKESPEEQGRGWSMSGENLSFSPRKEPADGAGSRISTTLGSMKIGQGSETATFTDVRSSCGMLELTRAFGSAAAPVRQCLVGSNTRRFTLVVEDGRITSSSIDPDDSVGRCVTNALVRARLEGLTCTLEASVSR